MRYGCIPNKKLQNPRTIAARKCFRTKPRRSSPRRHHESRRLDRRNRRANAINIAKTRIYRGGTDYYRPTSAGYLAALPNPISTTKKVAGEEQSSACKTILGFRVDGQGKA